MHFGNVQMISDILKNNGSICNQFNYYTIMQGLYTYRQFHLLAITRAHSV